MKRPWLVALPLLVGLWWAARRPAEAWGDDLELALARQESVVALVAAPDRPLSQAARDAVDEAWRELRPRARRVALERGTARIGQDSALALCVFAPGGELVARRDGPIEPAIAAEWLREALDAASSAALRAQAARTDPHSLFSHAELALRLGATLRAGEEFTQLATSADRELRAAANERLARLEIERGAVARSREYLALVDEKGLPTGASAQLLLTRGLIELAERENLAARATLFAAAMALAEASDSQADRARLELARAQAACGEESRAIATLDELARRDTSRCVRDTARRFADELFLPPVSH